VNKVCKLRSVTLKGITYYPVDLPAEFDGNAKRSKRYCSSVTAAKELRSRINRWKLSRKLKPDTLVLAETDRQWITYLHAELGPGLSALPAIIGHWRKTAVQLRKSTAAPNTQLFPGVFYLKSVNNEAGAPASGFIVTE